MMHNESEMFSNEEIQLKIERMFKSLDLKIMQLPA